jgi:hypothetical protein
MPRRVNLPLATAIVASTLSHSAAAQTHPEIWRTFRAGLSAGTIASDLSIDGQRASTLGPALAFSGEAGYTRSLARTAGAIGILGLGTWPDQWSNLAGEERYRVDLAVGGALRFLHGRGAKPARFFGSVTVGPTVSWIDAPVHIGIAEDFSLGWGLNAGLRAGLDLPLAGAHGLFFSAGAVTHATWLSRRTHVLRSPTVAVERYRVLDVQCLVSSGYVWERWSGDLR